MGDSGLDAPAQRLAGPGQGASAFEGGSPWRPGHLVLAGSSPCRSAWRLHGWRSGRTLLSRWLRTFPSRFKIRLEFCTYLEVAAAPVLTWSGGGGDKFQQ